ncbi:hypothetical protein MSAN_00611100 [Mycena sanguinolenta]|uniref:Uncharacterized protein n=1 Tax=Mycena sanguinolenta TaxID=230812 RepID=A0A8H6ZAI0_9AGAR|nr:hypothetical protein MSAN_00611100 [Mycena sanguinolenta]
MGPYIRGNWEGHKNTRGHLDKGNAEEPRHVQTETFAIPLGANPGSVGPNAMAEITANPSLVEPSVSKFDRAPLTENSSSASENLSWLSMGFSTTQSQYSMSNGAIGELNDESLRGPITSRVCPTFRESEDRGPYSDVKDPHFDMPNGSQCAGHDLGSYARLGANGSELISLVEGDDSLSRAPSCTAMTQCAPLGTNGDSHEENQIHVNDATHPECWLKVEIHETFPRRALLASVDPEDRKLAIRYRKPAITLGDKCLHHFMKFVVGNATSAIRQYRTQDGALYFASVGTGIRLRWGCIAMPGPASMQTIAKEFLAQGTDSVLSRTVFNHSKFVVHQSPTCETIWQSRFTVIQKSHSGIEFDWITTPDENLWLPRQRQFMMTLDLNYMNPNGRFKQVLDLLVPFFTVATQKMLVEYLIVILAVISKFPTAEQKLVYLAYLRTYLENRTKVGRDDEFSVYTWQQRSDLYQQACQQIAHLFETISESANTCNLYPSLEQAKAAEQFGFNMAQWDIGFYRYLASFNDSNNPVDLGAVRMAHSFKYKARIGPYREALKAAIYPSLNPDLLLVEPAYTQYGCQTRLKFEKYHQGELEVLPDLSFELAALPTSRIF